PHEHRAGRAPHEHRAGRALAGRAPGPSRASSSAMSLAPELLSVTSQSSVSDTASLTAAEPTTSRRAGSLGHQHSPLGCRRSVTTGGRRPGEERGRREALAWGLWMRAEQFRAGGQAGHMSRRLKPLPPALAFAVFTAAEARAAGVSAQRLRGSDISRL